MTLESLEERVVMSFGGYAVPGMVPSIAAAGGLTPFASPSPVGYTPQQLQAAYGLNQVSFAGIKGDGSGQTIVIVDPYDNPGFVNSTDPNFATSALHMFDLAYGLPDPPSFTKVNQDGASGPLAEPAGFTGWGLEIAIDIEWAHAMAPGASIVLVEAANSLNTSLKAAEITAGRLGTVVSMSYGSLGVEDPGEVNDDAHFNLPGVTFLASTGDTGVPSSYPAFSPYVVAVGGTTLQGLNAAGDYPGTGTNGEIGWSDGGGGYSLYEPQPSYQQSVQQSGFRSVPDVSLDADPRTGIGIYDPYDTGAATPWSQWGGTSISAPMMAGIIAIVDEGRQLNGGGAFSSTEALNALYSLWNTKPSDFHDILHGNNGYPAGPGYDLVTGLGTPNGSQLIPDLAGYGLSGQPVLQSIVVAPASSSLGAGLTEQYTATGTFSGGLTLNITNSVAWASSNTAAATINGFGIASALSAGTTQITASLGGVTSNNAALTVLPLVSIAVAPAQAYVPVLLSQQFTATGTFSDGSTGDLTRAAKWTSSNTATATIDASGLATAKALGTSVVTASLNGVSSLGVLLAALAPSFVVDTTADEVNYSDGKTSLREAILAANVYSGKTVTFDPSVFAAAQIIHLTLGSLDLTNQVGTEAILAPAVGLTVDAGGLSRVFSIAPHVTASITGLTITGGASTGRGGGVYSDRANLSLINCVVSGNTAGAGGGVYAVGKADLTDTTVSGNKAVSAGGGIAANNADLSLTACTVSGNSANFGGGLYAVHGKANLTGATISGNYASSSAGGILSALSDLTLTNSTVSGNSAYYFGGLYVYSGSAAMTNVTVAANSSSSYGGGGLGANGVTVSLTNTIVAGNTAPYGPGDVLGGVSGVNNLIGIGSGGLISGVDGNIVGVANPLLAPLGDYGGPTQTMALLPGSLAIDAGTSAGAPATDQRGLGRVGGVDVGAFESQGFKFTIVPGGTPQSADIGTQFARPLAVTVTANNPVEPIEGGVVLLVANPAANGASAILSAPSAVVAGGVAAVTAMPNNALGSYTVAVANPGSTASFSLTNTGAVFTSFVVNTTSDALVPGAGLISLREAVLLDNNTPMGNLPITFDEIVFSTARTITLTGSQLELTNTRGVASIIGPTAGVTISGGGLSRVFQIDSGVSASISGLTISGGYAGDSYGGGLANFGTLTLTDCTISGNSAAFAGGGVVNYSKLAMTRCAINDNSVAAYYGDAGGLLNFGTLGMTGCTVSGNSAGYLGGGMANFGTLTMNRCTVDANSASSYYGYGGGLFNFNSGTATLSNCTVSGNSAGGSGFASGGGVHNRGTISLINCTISGNSVHGFPWVSGGGLSNSGRATLTGCTISGNSAGDGGGVFHSGDAMTLTDCTISGNTATGSGGGVYTTGGAIIYYTPYGWDPHLYFATTTLNNCTVSGNTAGGSGGGLATGSVGITIANQTTIEGNTARNGGGVATNGSFFVVGLRAATTLNGCTVSGNTATENGGGLSTGGLGVTSANGTAITGNTAVDGGGVFTKGATFVTYSYPDGIINVDENGETDLSGCTVTGNTASGDGGGVGNGELGVTSVSRTRIMYNSADSGGGLANSGLLNVDSCSISYNQATSKGGGLSTTAGRANLVDSVITGNLVNSPGAALGGGVFSEDSILSMARCQIALNQATGKTAYGGGVYALNSKVSIQGYSVTGNAANGSQTGDGGGVYSVGGTLELWSTYVAGNTANNGTSNVVRKP